MTLKRKRSDSEISITSNSVLSSSPPNAMDICVSASPKSQIIRDLGPSHLSCRTHKRFRDNRPSEEIIHQHTLSMLFSAQKNHHSTPLPSPTPFTQVTTSRDMQQASLHSFWQLPNRSFSCGSSNSTASLSPRAIPHDAMNCEDCDAPLVSAYGDAMDVDMCDNSVDHGCSRCGKQVCHQCAVSNLGANRQCLICAGRRTWVGGLGWVDQH